MRERERDDRWVRERERGDGGVSQSEESPSSQSEAKVVSSPVFPNHTGGEGVTSLLAPSVSFNCFSVDFSEVRRAACSRYLHTLIQFD